MKIKIVAFGIAKDILKSRTLDLTIAEGTTVGQLKVKLVANFPDFEALRSLHLAVNKEYVDDNTIITALDEVVIIPPVSGG